MQALQMLASSEVQDALSAASSVGSGVTGLVTARRNASALEEAGEIIRGESLRESARLLGAQRAAFAKAGVDVGSGTPLDVLAETAEQEALSALRLKYGYDQAAYTERQAGIAALTGGLFEGATTALTGFNKRASTLPAMTYRLPRPGDPTFPKGPRY
jgi:hypothetical protein